MRFGILAVYRWPLGRCGFPLSCWPGRRTTDGSSPKKWRQPGIDFAGLGDFVVEFAFGELAVCGLQAAVNRLALGTESSIVNAIRLDGVVAQLVERLVRNEKVRGSTPLGSTILKCRLSN
jgi:hypothetical protein